MMRVRVVDPKDAIDGKFTRGRQYLAETVTGAYYRAAPSAKGCNGSAWETGDGVHYVVADDTGREVVLTGIEIEVCG